MNDWYLSLLMKRYEPYDIIILLQNFSNDSYIYQR